MTGRSVWVCYARRGLLAWPLCMTQRQVSTIAKFLSPFCARAARRTSVSHSSSHGGCRVSFNPAPTAAGHATHRRRQSSDLDAESAKCSGLPPQGRLS